MTTLSFTKMHGLGNNYIYIDCFTQPIPEGSIPQLARNLSDVNKGIGSDGIILISPSERATAKMRIFNKDGSEGTNCGNGLRCVAKYLYENHYVQSPTFQIETLSGLVEATIIDHNSYCAVVTINMGPPRLLRKDLPMLGNPHSQVINEPFSIKESTFYLTGVSMGNPHAVIFLPSIDHAPHYTLGPLIEQDQRFPKGVNVEFVQVINSKKLLCRVWERGSGVTQACGTGACAAAVAAVLNGKAIQGDAIQIELEGGTLEINWSPQGDVFMTGPAVTVATGVIAEYFKIQLQNPCLEPL